MRTYTAYNMTTMMKIVAAINCLPDDYALRNESVKSIEMDDDDKLLVIHFPAMTMRYVFIPEITSGAWMVDGWSTVFLQHKY